MGGNASRDRSNNGRRNTNTSVPVVRQQQQQPTPTQQPPSAYPYSYQQTHYQSAQPPLRGGPPAAASPPPAGPRVAVQEGATLKMLATIEPTTVHYEPEAQFLTFTVFATTTGPLWYRVHTMVRETIVNSSIVYTPHTKRNEPAKVALPSPCDNHEVAMVLELPASTQEHLTYNKVFPKFKPCVLELIYTDEQGNTHSEHTSVDLYNGALLAAAAAAGTGKGPASPPPPRRRVIDQIVVTGGSCYMVESVYGGEHEEVTVGQVAGGDLTGGTSPTSGVVVHESEEDELCVICLTEEKNTTVLPCKHMCVCKDCAQQLMNHSPKCPVCRGPITQLISR